MVEWRQNRDGAARCSPVGHKKWVKGIGSVADTGGVNDQRTDPGSTCDEVRSTRLHYRLRCLLPPGHDGDHRWTPELLPADRDEVATG
jgi:hypothetical protein